MTRDLGRRDFVRMLGGGVAAVTTGAACARGETPDAAVASGDTAASAATAPVAAAAGLQLYTVRSLMQQDFEGALRQVGDIGYREVEFAGYYDRTPAAVRAALTAAGLTSPAAHTGLQEFERDLDGTLATAADIGHSYVIVPFLAEDRRTADGYRRTAEQFNRLGERAAQLGLRFGYHNHDFELAPLGDTNGLAILLRETDPALVGFELDLFWVRKGGGDALALFERHPGRFPAVHVKDMDGSAEGRMVDVGQGVIDFAAIFAQAEQAGIRHYFVEHDNPAKPIESIRSSYQGLARLLTG